MFRGTIGFILIIFFIFCEAEYSAYLKSVKSIPEDSLVEFSWSDQHGRTFSLDQEDQFGSLRKNWRSNAKNYKPKECSNEEIDDIFSVKDSIMSNRFPTPIPMNPFIRYLWQFWPEIDADFPSASKIEKMGIEELVIGDWRFEDKAT